MTLGVSGNMERMAISKFKATCFAVIERVRVTGKPLVITRFGEVVAEILPPPPPALAGRWIGSMSSTGRIKGDIVAPVSGANDWDVMRP